MAVAAVTLDDKYTLEKGRVYLTGTQALVRLPMLQRQRDAAAGLDTACFITGYRGSPLGGFDQALWGARRFLDKNQIKFQPAINEELAATAVWGTQQVRLFPGAKHDGVFAIWYGKGPGVDRSGDPLKHGNSAGSAPNGGVLLLAGDDHTCKSSTLAHQSELAFIDASIPVLNPAGIEDMLDLGLYGWAMSRYSGCWVGHPRSRSHRHRPADRFRDAGRRAQHPLAGRAARPGIPAASVQIGGGAGLRARQSARPHRHRQPAPALRHRHHREILSRRAPGA
jgi:indolepyruvate ferredoxin oxidoreductase